ncbi:MAG: hypothetical protein NT016_02895 [Candidatus Aenigmarchaeota archaeon]|nr:hypothetical protein [Candidatus Aenigmarchaeota archaeon]
MPSPFSAVAPSRGVAVHTLVLVIMIAMFAILAIFIFYKWASPSVVEATTVSCDFKKLAYCGDWKANAYGTTPWDWSTKQPTGCDAYGITQPATKDDCKV